jgi:hypothetical protein
MKSKFYRLWTLALAIIVIGAGVAFAAIIVDDEGVGFVGKGDVQLLFGWNNAQLQACVNTAPAEPTDAGCLRFEFTLESTVVTERSWTCTNTNNENIQERERTTTTTTTTGGISASIARVRNQVTGFNLNGGDFEKVESPPETEGPPLNSCPSGPWALTTPAGDPVKVSEEETKTLTITDTRSNVSHTVEID